jgi:hypothetical protein
MMEHAEVVEWQTRTFEGRVAQAVRVQVPPSAPTYICPTRNLPVQFPDGASLIDLAAERLSFLQFQVGTAPFRLYEFAVTSAHDIR